jgi:transcriptional regulator with XRE-family HTH domain
MALQFPETDADRASWARLWAAVRTPWERTEDLARLLGVARSAVAQWATGTHRGPWSLLRAALRETARRHPQAISGLVEALAGELLDARGRWVPETDDDVGEWSDESADVTVTLGELHSAVRKGDGAKVREFSRALVVEAEQAGRAAARVVA